MKIEYETTDGFQHVKNSVKHSFEEDVVFAHRDSRRIIGYNRSNSTISHNIRCDSEADYTFELNRIFSNIKEKMNKKFDEEIPHDLRVGTVMIAHENVKSMSNSQVHFYQVLEVNSNSNTVKVVEIQAEAAEFGNFQQAVPLIGMQTGSSFFVDICQNSFKTSEGLLALSLEYSVIEIAPNVQVKVYKPVSFGFAI